jgi:hypothetical protein
MTVVQKFTTSADFWSGMVVPDCDESRANQADLRRALHAANSLFHMHDWIFHSYKISVQPNLPNPKYKLNYIDILGNNKSVSSEREFANELERLTDDFGRIRGIANAAKHLKLGDVRPVKNAPSDAANTRSQVIGYGQRYGQAYGGGALVMLEGDNGNDMQFSTILESVYQMWEAITKSNSW